MAAFPSGLRKGAIGVTERRQLTSTTWSAVSHRAASLIGRLVALAILALVLGFGWLVTGVAGMSGISDVCSARIPVEAQGVLQQGGWWPPTLTCTYNRSDDAAPIVIRQDGEARIRLAGAVGAALAAGACWSAAAWVLLRRHRATGAGR